MSPVDFRARIVGGKMSKRGWWPWQIGLYKNNDEGNLISIVASVVALYIDVTGTRLETDLLLNHYTYSPARTFINFILFFFNIFNIFFNKNLSMMTGNIEMTLFEAALGRQFYSNIYVFKHNF